MGGRIFMFHYHLPVMQPFLVAPTVPRDDARSPLPSIPPYRNSTRWQLQIGLNLDALQRCDNSEKMQEGKWSP